MDIIWGALIALIGLFLGISGFLKSDFIVYRILSSRSRVLWRGNVHSFYIVVGILMVAFGILFATGVI